MGILIRGKTVFKMKPGPGHQMKQGLSPMRLCYVQLRTISQEKDISSISKNRLTRGGNSSFDNLSLRYLIYSLCIYQRPGLLRDSVLKSMLINKDSQSWHLIGWQHSRQPIKGHDRKLLLTYMDFNKDSPLVIQAPYIFVNESTCWLTRNLLADLKVLVPEAGIKGRDM